MTLIVHVPHASTYIPDEMMSQYLLSSRDVREEAIVSADLYTDILAESAWPEAKIVCAEVSRIVIDVERYSNDADEVMSQVGRGMIYSATHDGRPLRRAISDEVRESLKEKWYDSHWKKLRSLTNNATLIDLHSYPFVPWKVEQNQLSYRPEIDLGVDTRLTPNSWVENLKSHFESHGYSVGINTPYKGVIDAGSKFAVMIEIRRDSLGSPADVKIWQRIVEAMSSIPLLSA